MCAGKTKEIKMQKNKIHFAEYLATAGIALTGTLFLAGLCYAGTRAASSLPPTKVVSGHVEQVKRLGENKAQLFVKGDDGKTYFFNTYEMADRWDKECTHGKRIAVNGIVGDDGEVSGLIDRMNLCK